MIPEDYHRELLIYAFRYTLGRMSYSPYTVMSVLRDVWNDLSAGDQKLYQREIAEAIEHDLAGMNFDVKAWASILDWPVKK